MAISSWQDGIPLKVLPVGINYSSFTRFGKNIFINFGEIIEQKDINISQSDGIRNNAFNELLERQLKNLVFEIKKEDTEKQHTLLEYKPAVFKKIALFPVAGIGWLIHFPLYLPLKSFTKKKTGDTDHYDSVLTGLLLLLYSFYLVLLTLVLFFITKSPLSFLLLAVLPFTAWSYTQLKSQLDK